MVGTLPEIPQVLFRPPVLNLRSLRYVHSHTYPRYCAPSWTLRDSAPYPVDRAAAGLKIGRLAVGVCRRLSSLSVTITIPLRIRKVKMKRSHSPSLTAPAKVQHSSETSDASGGRRRNLSFDEVFYDELILVIFSHLSAPDLCVIQPTNKNWARLSQDNQVHSDRDVDELDVD